jgi:hypothetical protein
MTIINSRDYLNSLQSEFPKVCKKRKKVDEEFFEKGRIPDALSILYYPGQHALQYEIPIPHSELLVENSIINFRVNSHDPIPGIKSYSKRIYDIGRSIADKPTPLIFVRIGITITPKQLNHLLTDIKNLRAIIGWNCMDGVKIALDRYADYHIPRPICLYPGVTAATLLIAKKFFGSNRISSIDPQIYHRTRTVRTINIISGVVPEVLIHLPFAIAILSLMIILLRHTV